MIRLRTAITVLFLAGCFVASTSKAQVESPASPSSQSVEAAIARFVTAFENLDWANFRDCFSPQATIFHPAAPNIRRIDSPAEFDSAWQGVFERIRKNSGLTAPPYMKLNIQDQRIERLSPDIALVTFHLVDAGTIGRRTILLQRMDGVWKIVHIHASNFTPP
jgi:ketosteroid isomerase-like protein